MLCSFSYRRDENIFLTYPEFTMLFIVYLFLLHFFMFFFNFAYFEKRKDNREVLGTAFLPFFCASQYLFNEMENFRASL